MWMTTWFSTHYPAHWWGFAAATLILRKHSSLIHHKQLILQSAYFNNSIKRQIQLLPGLSYSNNSLTQICKTIDSLEFWAQNFERLQLYIYKLKLKVNMSHKPLTASVAYPDWVFGDVVYKRSIITHYQIVCCFNTAVVIQLLIQSPKLI